MSDETRSVSQMVDVTGITPGAYATGQVMGGILTFDKLARANYRGGLIANVYLFEFGTQNNQAIDVLFLSRQIAVPANKATWAIGTNDVPARLGTVSLLAANYIPEGANSSSVSANAVGIVSYLDSSNNTGVLYAVLVSRGTGNYTAANPLRLRIGVLQD